MAEITLNNLLNNRKNTHRRHSSAVSRLKDGCNMFTTPVSLKEDYYINIWQPASESKRFAFETWHNSPQKYKIELGDKEFEVSQKLKNIHDEILLSGKYLEFGDDWDDENAVGCVPEIYFRTITLLLIYSEYVFKYYDIVISAPEINFAADGSFDLEWRTKNRLLLINIVNSDKIDIHFYGKDIKLNTILKGILSDFEINRELSHWMQSLI